MASDMKAPSAGPAMLYPTRPRSAISSVGTFKAVDGNESFGSIGLCGIIACGLSAQPRSRNQANSKFQLQGWAQCHQ